MSKTKNKPTKAKPSKNGKPNTRGRKKGEQQHLDGMGPEKNPVIHPIAVEYVRVRDMRMDLMKDEVKLKVRLLAAMHQADLKAYEYDDINVILTSKEDLKVKIHGHDPEGGK